eukprot:UN04790
MNVLANCHGVKDIGGAMERYIPLKVSNYKSHNDVKIKNIFDTEYKDLFTGVGDSLGNSRCSDTSEKNPLCTSITVAVSTDNTPLVLVSKAKNGLVIHLNFMVPDPSWTPHHNDNRSKILKNAVFYNFTSRSAEEIKP